MKPLLVGVIMYRINEIFFSIQGEGHRVGTPVVFVRFSGCNLECTFCDTDHSAYQEMSVEDIWRTADKLWRQGTSGFPKRLPVTCVFTGGEPLLQVDRSLVRFFDHVECRMWIETNGSFALEEKQPNGKLNSILSCFGEVIVSPKSGRISEKILGHATCLKLLCGKKEEFEWMLPYEKMIEITKRNPRKTVYVLQPITPLRGVLSSEWFDNCTVAVEMAHHRLLYGEQWRVIPQVHKFIGVR